MRLRSLYVAAAATVLSGLVALGPTAYAAGRPGPHVHGHGHAVGRRVHPRPVHAPGHGRPIVQRHPVRAHLYRGYLTAAPSGATAPATLTIQTPRAGTITVTVEPTTRIVRRYGAPSSLDELSPNDVLEVRGTVTGPGAVTATLIRDISIQIAFTRMVGQVTTVTASSVSVVVQRDLYRRAPFPVGSNQTLPVGPSTEVISGTTVMTGSTSEIAQGDRIVALGVYNRASDTFTSTFRIRILPTAAPRPRPVAYRGYLTTAPLTTTAPTTLTIQTERVGTVSVVVGPTTVIVRRYGAPSSLDELSANDVLDVRGTLTAPGTVVARYIRDVSIQVAFTRLVGQVTAVNSTATPPSVSVVVQRDETGRSPFTPGENLTLPIDPSTQVISGTTVTTGSLGPLAVNQRITALGIFNRVSNTFTSTFRIRIL